MIPAGRRAGTIVFLLSVSGLAAGSVRTEIGRLDRGAPVADVSAAPFDSVNRSGSTPAAPATARETAMKSAAAFEPARTADVVVGRRSVRVGILIGASVVRVRLASGAMRGEEVVPPGNYTFFMRSGRIESRGPSEPSGDVVELAPPPVAAKPGTPPDSPDRLICVESACYRGTIRLIRSSRGLDVVNDLPIEDYLLGVVPGEIGRKLPASAFEAVKAQAVVARTYTLRSLGQYGAKPYDVFATVSDQVYDGARGEDPLCSRAVRETEGLYLSDGAFPIDAFYHSTSGGATAAIRDVWPQKPDRPYLRGIRDSDATGVSFSAASRHQVWSETWSAAQLHQAVRRDLAEALGRPASPGRVRGLATEGVDPSGRVRTLVVETTNGRFEVHGDRIRWALRRPVAGSPILRSTRFRLRREGDSYIAEGSGFGHGVGLSQTGALGRSAVGHSFRQILEAYYPGTTLRRWASGDRAGARPQDAPGTALK